MVHYYELCLLNGNVACKQRNALALSPPLIFFSVFLYVCVCRWLWKCKFFFLSLSSLFGFRRNKFDECFGIFGNKMLVLTKISHSPRLIAELVNIWQQNATEHEMKSRAQWHKHTRRCLCSFARLRAHTHTKVCVVQLLRETKRKHPILFVTIFMLSIW